MNQAKDKIVMRMLVQIQKSEVVHCFLKAKVDSTVLSEKAASFYISRERKESSMQCLLEEILSQ